MRIAFQDSDRADGCGVYLEIPRLGSWSWSESKKKTTCGVCGQEHRTFYDRKTRRVRDLSCGDTRVYLEVEFRRVACRGCGLVKQEKLTWIADNPLYTKRFAFFVGRRCRASPLKDVAKQLHLDWQTVNPTDSSLLGAGVRVLTRVMKRVTEVAGEVGTKLRDRSRSVKLRAVPIARVSRSKSEQG